MRTLATLWLCPAAPVALAEGVGVFTDVKGDTRVLRGQTVLAAEPGVDVDVDDIVETAAGASAQLDMNDGSLPVRAGEFVERRAGRAFHRSGTAPAAFRARMPPVMHRKIQRRVHLLKQRALKPRVLRQLRPQDRERYLRLHPQRRQHVERRRVGDIRVPPRLRRPDVP